MKTKDGFRKLNSDRLTTNTSNAQNYKQTSNVSSHMVETSSSVRMELPLQIKVEPEDTPTTNSFNNDTNWNVDNNIHTVECPDVKVKDEMDRTDDPSSCMNSTQDGTIVKLSTYSAGKKRNFNVKVPAPKRQRGSVIDSCKLVLHVPQTSTVVNSKECMNSDEKSTTSSEESVKQGNDIVVPECDNNDNLKEADIGTHNNIQMTASNDGNTRKFSVSYSTPAVQVPREQYNLQNGCTNVKQEPISYNVRQLTKNTYAIQINPDKCTAKGNTTGGYSSRWSTSVNCHVPNFWFKSHDTMNKEKVKQTKQISQESHVHVDHTYSIKESTSKQTEASIHEYGHATSKAAEHVSTDCTQNAGRQTSKQTFADVNISESDTCNSNGTQNVDTIGENHILLDNIKAESHEYVGNANGTNDFAKQAPENSIADSSMSDKIGDHNASVNKNDDYGPVTQTESDTDFETNEFQLAIESETDGKSKYHVLKNATDRPSGIIIICGYCFGKFKTLKCFVSHFSTSCTRFKPGALPVLIKHDSCSNVRYLCAFCNVLRNSYLECLHHMSACARVVETFRMNGSYINLEIFMSPECQSCHSTDISKVFRRFGAPHRLYIDRMMKVSATSFCKCKGPLDKFKLSYDRNCDRNSSVKDSIDINVQHCNSTGMNLKTFDTIIPTCSLFLGTHFLRFEDRNSHAFTCGFCSLTAYNISEFLPHIEHCQTEKKIKGLPYCISDNKCVSWWDGEDCVKAGFMCAHCIVRVSSFGECIEHMDHCEFADKHLPNVQFAVIPPCLVCHDRRLTGEDRTDSMINMVEIFRLIYDKLNKKFKICDTSNINHPCNQINKKKPLIKSVVLTETYYHSSTHELVSEYTGDRAAYVGSFETVNMKPHTSDSNIGINSKPKKTKFVHNANLMVEQTEVLIPNIENDYGADYGINAITDNDNAPSMLTADESKPNDSGKSADLDVESEGTNGSISVVSDELVTTKESIIGYNSHGKLPCKEIKHNGVEIINLMNDSSSTHPRMDEDKYQHIRKVQAATICLKNKCRCFQKYAYHEVRKATQTFHCGYCRELFKSFEAFFDHILKCRLTNDCIILPVRLAGRFLCGLCPVIYSRLCLAVHHIETCAKTFPCVDQDRTFGSMKIRLLSDRCFKHRSYIFNIRNDANNQVDEQFVLYQQALQQRSTFNICNCNLNFKSGSFNTENSIEQNSGGQGSSKQSSGGQSSSKRSSKGQKPFRKACCICAEKFTNEILYNLHRDLHQNQSELCYICGYVNNSLRMRKHISSVHRMNFSGNSLPSIERRKIECVCHLCGKNFAYNHYLKKHFKYTCRSNDNRLKRRFKRNHEGKIVVLN